MKNKLLLLAIGIMLSAQTLVAQVPSYVPTQGFVGYWPFSGNANDLSGNSNNGVVNGATLTNVRNGNAYGAPPANDDPCNAIPLTVGTTCNYAPYTNALATASIGILAPGCAVYSGGDVWFSVVVPASGGIIIDTDEGTITDGGMAIYSGPNCNNLNTLIACDDDGSSNGLMPSISQTGLTPGATLYIRVWEYGNNNNGTFSICVNASIFGCSTTAPTGSTSQTFCSGSTVTNLTATGTNIQWYSTSVDGTALASTTTLVNGTTYYASQTLSGCESTSRLAVTVTLNPLPNATISGTTTVCSGTNAVVTFTGTPYAAVTYTENGGALQTIVLDATGTALHITPSLTVSSIYTLVSVTSNGCTQPLSESAFINVNPLPTATISGTTTVCINSASPITFTGTSGIAQYTFTYNINGGPNQTITTLGDSVTLFVPTNTIGVFNYQLISVANSALPACSQLQTGTSTVTVTPPTIVPDFAEISFCAGTQAPVLLTTSPNGITGTWSPTVIDNATVGTTTYNFTPDAGQCAFNQTIYVDVTAPNIVPDFTAIQTFCAGTVAPELPSISPNGITGYWNPSVIDNLTIGTTTYNFQPDFGQCATDTSLNVTVIAPPPSPSGANNQTVSQGSNLANLVVTGQDVQWYADPFGGAPLPLNTPLVNLTTYYASQTINGCESQDRFPVIAQAATLSNEVFGSIKIVYSPNPVIDILNVKASTILKHAKICNVLGQTIFQQRFNSKDIQLNMSDVPSGTYFVIVESDNRKETFKVLKK